MSGMTAESGAKMTPATPAATAPIMNTIRNMRRTSMPSRLTISRSSMPARTVSPREVW